MMTETVQKFELTHAERDILFSIIWDTGDVSFCGVHLLHYEVAVISFEIVKDDRYFSYTWFDFEFQVERFVCWTSVLACEMAVISYFWIGAIFYFLFTYPAVCSFFIGYFVLFFHC